MSAFEHAAAGLNDGPGGARSARAPAWRWVLPCAALACALIALAVLGGLSEQPGGPVGSSYATGAGGVAAWAQLLARRGYDVVALRQALGRASLPADETVVLLEPDALLHSEGVRLMSFARAGGRLVYGAGDPQATLTALLAPAPAWRAGGADLYFAHARGDQATAGVVEVSSAGEGHWLAPRAGYAAPLRARDGGALLLERQVGAGTLELLSDISPVQNRLLASADNAQLALDLAGPTPRRVAFVESVHGYGNSRGLAALPAGWRVALAGLVLAGLLWIASRARRLGPPEPSVEALAPARSAYADAIALLLRRTNDQQGISSALERWRGR